VARLNPISVNAVFCQLPYYIKVSGARHESAALLLEKGHKVATRRQLGENENPSIRCEAQKSVHVYQESKLYSSVFESVD